MKKFNPNKNIIITLILAIIVITIISVTASNRASQEKTNFAQSTVNDSVGAIERLVSAPGRWLGDGVGSIKNLFNTYQENQELKAKIDSYDEMVQKSQNYEDEIAALKDELSLNQTLTSYEKVTGNVISRSPDTWQDLLVIDSGSQDGIEVNMAVMSQKGLIGRIIEVSAFTSKVELLTSSNQSSNHFPVQVNTGSGNLYGLLSSYDEKSKTLIVSQITGDNDISEGDVVQTSGLGGNSPANLAIGTVKKVEPDKFGLERQIYVEPYAEMYDIKVVTVVKRLVEEG